jgi:putative transposase
VLSKVSFSPWKLPPTTNTPDVQKTLEIALRKTGVNRVNVFLRARLLCDDRPCYISKDLKAYLNRRHIEHNRSVPYHSMIQGKIECYHHSMKNVVNLQNYFSLDDLEQEIVQFVDYYNNQRYHESLNNLTPMDVYTSRAKEVLAK